MYGRVIKLKRVLKDYKWGLALGTFFVWIKYIILFLIIISILFSAIQNKSNVSWSVLSWKYLNCKVEIEIEITKVLFMSSLYILLPEIGSIYQDIIQLCIFIKLKFICVMITYIHYTIRFENQIWIWTDYSTAVTPQK